MVRYERLPELFELALGNEKRREGYSVKDTHVLGLPQRAQENNPAKLQVFRGAFKLWWKVLSFRLHQHNWRLPFGCKTALTARAVVDPSLVSPVNPGIFRHRSLGGGGIFLLLPPLYTGRILFPGALDRTLAQFCRAPVDSSISIPGFPIFLRRTICRRTCLGSPLFNFRKSMYSSSLFYHFLHHIPRLFFRSNTIELTGG